MSARASRSDIKPEPGTAWDEHVTRQLFASGYWYLVNSGGHQHRYVCEEAPRIWRSAEWAYRTLDDPQSEENDRGFARHYLWMHGPTLQQDWFQECRRQGEAAEER